jgi:hypothetical protein
VVRREFDNLRRLAAFDPDHVIAPSHYAASDVRELLVATYIHQGRCIANQFESGWGVYIPEPRYRFEPFAPDTTELVCAFMIALMIRLHDGQRGIAAAKLGGGDFVLEKRWDRLERNVQNTLACLKLVAARETVEVRRDEYVQILRREYVRSSFYEDEGDRDKSMIVNWRARLPMTVSAVEWGIEIAGRAE